MRFYLFLFIFIIFLLLLCWSLYISGEKTFWECLRSIFSVVFLSFLLFFIFSNNAIGLIALIFILSITNIEENRSGEIFSVSERSPIQRTSPGMKLIELDINNAIVLDIPEDIEDGVNLSKIDYFYIRCQNPVVKHYFNSITIQNYCIRDIQKCVNCPICRDYEIEPQIYKRTNRLK